MATFHCGTRGRHGDLLGRPDHLATYVRTVFSQFSHTMPNVFVSPIDALTDFAADEPIYHADAPMDLPSGAENTENKKTPWISSWKSCITRVAQGVLYRLKRSDGRQFCARCKDEGCHWVLGATKLSKTNLFRIHRMNDLDTHTCGVGSLRASASGKLVASIVKKKLRDTPSCKPLEIIDDIRQDFRIELNYSQAHMGIAVVLEELQGSHTKAYSQLPLLCEKILETNPGSAAILNTKYDSTFAIVDLLSDDHWHWFLQPLKTVLSTSHEIIFVAESLKNKFKGSLSLGVVHVLISEFHKAAYTPTAEEFKKSVETIKNISPEAYEWILQTEPEHWANAFFKGARYNHLKSSVTESFYDWVSDLPVMSITQVIPVMSITQVIEMIRHKMMEFIYTRKMDPDQWSSKLTPSAEENLRQSLVDSRSLEVVLSPGSCFKVRDTLDVMHVVSLENWECNVTEDDYRIEQNRN
ncbi:Pseudouridine synthase family protein isoform 1 [Hibiscus syriacus]|uniref:Pseudouridine synthase family protein isoform 1 n=1 Tax=Hibiscus syriacus TaxID=106335 RepID=A0A6A3D474_HIBSY|nr:Pseudouridine synthase family protein isoform 1 [Hibiscus syriacus]